MENEGVLVVVFTVMGTKLNSLFMPGKHSPAETHTPIQWKLDFDAKCWVICRFMTKTPLHSLKQEEVSSAKTVLPFDCGMYPALANSEETRKKKRKRDQRTPRWAGVSWGPQRRAGSWFQITSQPHLPCISPGIKQETTFPGTDCWAEQVKVGVMRFAGGTIHTYTLAAINSFSHNVNFM